jgi:hypothetical protein
MNSNLEKAIQNQHSHYKIQGTKLVLRTGNSTKEADIIMFPAGNFVG